jgi:predicted RNase H-like nuclease
MLHAGVPLLIDAGVHLPGLHAGDAARVALEAYPGLLAREVLQRRSYKSDDSAKHTPERLIARKDLVNALELGETRLSLRLKLSHAQRDALVQDASGDCLDAVLCLVQAAWAQRQHADEGDTLYGLPPRFDPLEGWIVTAPMPGAAGQAPAA